MTEVHHAPASGKRGGTPIASRALRPAVEAKPARRDAVHWSDPADIKLWIFALRGGSLPMRRPPACPCFWSLQY
jgi:hypothetical protein